MVRRDYIDDMVDVFGCGYVIGQCLWSEYDLKNKASKEEDEGKVRMYLKSAKRYANKVEDLTRERMQNGL